MTYVKIKIKRMTDDLRPKYQSPQAVGMDLHAAIEQGKLVHALGLSASCSGCGVSEHVGWDREDMWMGRAC